MGHLGWHVANGTGQSLAVVIVVVHYLQCGKMTPAFTSGHSPVFVIPCCRIKIINIFCIVVVTSTGHNERVEYQAQLSANLGHGGYGDQDAAIADPAVDVTVTNRIVIRFFVKNTHFLWQHGVQPYRLGLLKDLVILQSVKHNESIIIADPGFLLWMFSLTCIYWLFFRNI